MARGEFRIEMDSDSDPQVQYATPEDASPGDPFHLLVLGDFSGRGTGGEPHSAPAPLAERDPVAVDRDTVGRAMEHFSPSIRIGPDMTVRFGSVEDFHPDHLHESLPLFDRIEDAARAGGGGSERDRGATDGDREAAGDDRGSPEPVADGSLLDEIVAEEEGEHPPGSDPSSVSDDLSDYVREIVEPHLVSEPDDDERARQERREEALQEAMRSILHDRRFQGAESVWRGVRFLARRLETGPDLGIHLLDLSRPELEEALPPGDDPRDSPLHRHLVADRAGTPGAEPWGLVIGLYQFGPGDAGLLERIGQLSRRAGAPFLSSAAPELAGLETARRRPSRSDWSEVTDRDWAALRRSDVARWIGLALPRFLLRAPYDPDDAPCRTMDLQELPEEAREEASEAEVHERYLWGNPALLCAALLGQSFRRSGWELRPGEDRRVDRLPLHIYDRDGRSEAKPSAEMLMTEEVAGRLMERGFIPVASVKERGAAQVVRFQSVADPPTALAGRWQTNPGG